MIEDLGSQVEQTSSIEQKRLPSLDLGGVVNGRSSETEESLNMDNVNGQSLNAHSSKSHQRNDEAMLGSNSDLDGNHTMPQSCEDPDSMVGVVGADKDGHLVVKDRFWTVFCKEVSLKPAKHLSLLDQTDVEEIFESIHRPMSIQHFEEHGSSSALSISNHQSGSRFYNFLLRHTSAVRLEEDSCPAPSQMAYLWRVYVDNVDPFVKILHVPSMAQITHNIKGTYQSLSSSMHALVMAVAFAAVMSLDDLETGKNFNASKEETLTSCRLAIEKSLERVDILEKPELPAVQALTLYLNVLQSIGETKSAWVLAGSLARSAAFLKPYNNINGCTFDAFEEQMQCRLRGQISILDSRPQGMSISDNSFSDVKYHTKAPAHLNDVDLYPGMSGPPKNAKGWTDTTITLIRFNIRQLPLCLQETPAKPPFKLGQLEARRTVIEEVIEVTCLQYIDPTKPLHCFVAASTRLFTTKFELLLQAKQRSVKTSQRMPTIMEESPSFEVLASAITIIELTYSLQNEPKWKGWRWQLHGHRPPYQAIRVVLTHLCTNPLDPRYERTLSIVQRTLDSLSDSAREDPAYSLVVDLLASAVQRQQASPTHDVDADKLLSSMGGDDLTSETALNNLKLSAPRGDTGSGVPKGVPDPSQDQAPAPGTTATTLVGNFF